jgi:phenylacetate-coenzyme A ligase PaaK-like adenylate-forming protein
MREELGESIFRISNSSEFYDIALEIFRFQLHNNPVYQQYGSILGTDINAVNSLEQIPFLPIEFFKNHRVITGNSPSEKVFESSGTTGSMTSRHYVTDLALYEKSFVSSFRRFYGDPEDYFFAALLPSYTERDNSSLVYMADFMIRNSSDSRSSFFFEDKLRLLKILKIIRTEKRKGMLIGVSFALLDLAEEFFPDLNGIIVVETGGMKGRRKEITREELHNTLKEKLHIASVHSEYGMTELLSQAWSKGDGLFQPPPWMKIILREINDPLSLFTDHGITGGINIIDLANINSCSFISTGDLGRLHPDGSFEVLGRFGNSDLRGCNLLI